ncbi:MAG TPA: LysM peptidoglycan-binding domain-containing protein [Ktedonobacteraceae bacterium]|jgi:LysM repeat protein|nr:LysM peptidoglycan-binding domain-containing protein [Ktedonobacteraceae bacterium]
MLLLHKHISKFLQQDVKKSSIIKFGSMALGLMVLVATMFVTGGTSAHAATVCDGTTHIVRSGETLSGIAAQYGTRWSTLASTNGISNPNLIFVDQSICISGTTHTTSYAPVQQPPVQQPPVQQPPVQQYHQSAPTAAPTTSGSIPGMISQVFGANAGSALNVARCESGFNPQATNSASGAAGVFQFLPSTWSTTSQAGQSPYNAYANIAAAHEVFVRDGYSWREWSCQP